MKALGSTQEVHLKLPNLSTGEEGGIPGVEVKFVDIRITSYNVCYTKLLRSSPTGVTNKGKNLEYIVIMYFINW